MVGFIEYWKHTEKEQNIGKMFLFSITKGERLWSALVIGKVYSFWSGDFNGFLSNLDKKIPKTV